MLVLLLCVEGVLLTTVSSSSNIINTDDVEQLHPTIFEKDGGISEAYISKRSIMNFRNYFTYFQGPKGEFENCGKINSNERNFLIIKGDDVKPPYKYPWMVQVQGIQKRLGRGRMLMNNCSGAIINEYDILTAAHCVEKGKGRNGFLGPNDVTVRFLTNTYELTPPSEVQRVIPHPEYNSQTLEHDIALLTLKKRIIFDTYKSPICLPPPNLEIPVGTAITIAGWGATETTAFSNTLREGSVKHVNFVKCSSIMSVEHLEETTYCYVGMEQKNQIACTGDSGGPSFYNHDGKYYVVGITSAAVEGCPEGSPTIYTAVPKYLNWLDQVMTKKDVSKRSIF